MESVVICSIGQKYSAKRFEKIQIIGVLSETHVLRSCENDFGASASSPHSPIPLLPPLFISIINFLSVVWLILEKLLGNSVLGFPGGSEQSGFILPFSAPRVMTHAYFLSGPLMATLPVLVHSGITCT